MSLKMIRESERERDTDIDRDRMREREREREREGYYVCQNSHALNDSLGYKWLDMLFSFCRGGWSGVGLGLGSWPVSGWGVVGFV